MVCHCGVNISSLNKLPHFWHHPLSEAARPYQTFICHLRPISLDSAQHQRVNLLRTLVTHLNFLQGVPNRNIARASSNPLAAHPSLTQNLRHLGSTPIAEPLTRA